MKQALIVAFFGALRDRFTQHGEALTLREKLRRAAAIPDVTGVEVIFPDECTDANELREAVFDFGLKIAAVNVNLKGKPEFQKGALSVADSTVRNSAISLIVAAKNFAHAVGAERVTCAPLNDGYDYPLQQSHTLARIRAIESIRSAVQEGAGIPLHLEHKPSDPRVRGLLATPEETLRLILAVDRPGLGMTYNIGHQSLDGLSPASSMTPILESEIPLYLHVCDAAGTWDWDLLPGVNHTWQLLEIFRLLRRHEYSGWLTSDSFPIRSDARMFETSHVSRVAQMWALSAQCPDPSDSEDPTTSWKEVERWLFQSR